MSSNGQRLQEQRRSSRVRFTGFNEVALSPSLAHYNAPPEHRLEQQGPSETTRPTDDSLEDHGYPRPNMAALNVTPFEQSRSRPPAEQQPPITDSAELCGSPEQALGMLVADTITYQDPFLATVPSAVLNPRPAHHIEDLVFVEPRRDSNSTLTDAHVNATVGAGQRLHGPKRKGDDKGDCACQRAADVGSRPPLKPVLRRRQTEDDPSAQAAREAAALVDNHVDTRYHHSHRSGSSHIDDEEASHNQQFTSGACTAGDEETPANVCRQETRSGVLSNLLKLSSSGLKRTATSSSWASGATSVAPSRDGSTDSHYEHGMRHRRPRRDSDWSTTSVYHIDAKFTKANVSNGSSRRRRGSNASVAPWNQTFDEKGLEHLPHLPKHRRSIRKVRRLSVTVHVTALLIRHKFILKLAKALMTFGAPSHRIEAQLNTMSDILHVDGHFVHLPAIVIASFGDQDTRTNETHFVKAGGGLNLGNLTEVHEIYRCVAHDEISAEEGTQRLTRLLTAKPIYGLWIRVLIAAVCAASICMLGFSGSILDGLVSALFGAILAFLQIRVAASNPMYSNIFEISMATLVSFAGRGLATTHFFCYEAISSSGVVLILPGYVILCGSLELASRNIIAGSVKLVYAIIYSLFLGFGIAIGSDFYYLFDKRPGAQISSVSNQTPWLSSTGLLTFANATLPSLNGTFTLTETSAGLAQPTDVAASLQQGSVTCIRDPDWQWWRQTVSPWWGFLLVPIFSVALSLWNLQPVRDRQFPVMVSISIIGYVTNYLANQYIFDQSDVVSFIGSFVIGILGNLYSRIFRGTAFTAMITGVLFLVPSGIAAAGGLSITEQPMGNSTDSYSNGLTIGLRMIQVAIGITVGLFFASFLIYSFFSGRKRSAVLFAF